MKKYYLAYGSNLSLLQMSFRCPNAIPVGTATLKDYELLFKGSLTGNYLTVEKQEGSSVPLVVWEISEDDEKSLDVYEGFPEFYYKEEMEVEVKPFLGEDTINVSAIIYIMHEDRLKGLPSQRYYDVVKEGYERFGFDVNTLNHAVFNSVIDED